MGWDVTAHSHYNKNKDTLWGGVGWDVTAHNHFKQKTRLWGGALQPKLKGKRFVSWALQPPTQEANKGCPAQTQSLQSQEISVHLTPIGLSSPKGTAEPSQLLHCPSGACTMAIQAIYCTRLSSQSFRALSCPAKISKKEMPVLKLSCPASLGPAKIGFKMGQDLVLLLIAKHLEQIFHSIPAMERCTIWPWSNLNPVPCRSDLLLFDWAIQPKLVIKTVGAYSPLSLSFSF